MPLDLACQALEGHTDRVWTLAWNPAGTVLASSGADKSIRLWAQENVAASQDWSCVAKLMDTHNKSIRRLCWSPCGGYLASASFDSTICIWKKDAANGSWSTIVNLEGHESEVKSVAWSFDGNYLASSGRDKSVWIWERAPREVDASVDELDDIDGAAEWDCADVKNDHGKDVKHIVWHPHHNILVSCSYDDTVKFFHKDGEDWMCYQTLTSHTSTVWSADFSPTGEYLVTCSDDKTVRVWKNHSHEKLPIVEPNAWKCLSVMQGYHNRTIYDVSWCNFNDLIASGAGDNSIVIYSRTSDDTQGDDIFTCVHRQSQSHDCDVNCVVWNPKLPNLLASSSDDRKIKLWKYTADDKGMRKPLTIVDELLNELSKASLKQTESDDTDSKQTSESRLTFKVADPSNLLNLTKNLQKLQKECYRDEDRIHLRRMLKLKDIDDVQPLMISGLTFNQQTGFVSEFLIDILDTSGEIVHKMKILVDEEKFSLILPRRSVKLIVVADELFLIEKTGDLFKILASGKSQFLLGHLFTFADVQFVVNEIGDKIIYIITADRDEKLRISRYPNTFDIERYCFGHKHRIKSIVLLADGKFASIDHANEVLIWDLKKLKDSPDKPLVPERTFSFNESANKRIRNI